MNVTSIVCLTDLLRGIRAFPEGVFDLVREPIAQGCGLALGYPPGAPGPQALQGFSIERFRRLAGAEAQPKQAWARTYYQMPPAAEAYLFEHLPADSLVLGFEMPPWLTQACSARDIHYLDVRVSPLRFGRDLYFALRTRAPQLYERIAQQAVGTAELRLEAAQLAANVRMHGRRQAEAGASLPALEHALVFIGQAPYDASLLGEQGRALGCDDFAPALRLRLGTRTLWHKAHPFSPHHAVTERAALQRLCGVPVLPYPANAYQLLCADEDVQLVGLSSGLLQEAGWFGKTAHTLYRPFVPLAEPHQVEPNRQPLEHFQQVRFGDAVAPCFWHAVLQPGGPPPLLGRLPALAHAYGSETLDHWWDYAKVPTWNRSLRREAFQRAGGAHLLCELEQLREALTSSLPTGGHRPE